MALLFIAVSARTQTEIQIMCKREICEQIIALVSKVTEVPPSQIMSSCKRPDVVDARYLAIYLMHIQGIRAYHIAEFMSMTERNVYHIQERFEDRMKYGDPMVRNYYNSTVKALKQV